MSIPNTTELPADVLAATQRVLDAWAAESVAYGEMLAAPTLTEREILRAKWNARTTKTNALMVERRAICDQAGIPVEAVAAYFRSIESAKCDQCGRKRQRRALQPLTVSGELADFLATSDHPVPAGTTLQLCSQCAWALGDDDSGDRPN